MKINNIKADKMRYQKNSIAYRLVLLSLITGMIGLFTVINFDSFDTTTGSIRVVPDFRVGIEIIIGILVMLTTFLAAEKVKMYDPKWSFYGLFILAGLNAYRIFNLPMYAKAQGWIETRTMVTVMIYYAITAGLLVAAGIISTRKVLILFHHMKELNSHGNDAV